LTHGKKGERTQSLAGAGFSFAKKEKFMSKNSSGISWDVV
jgi:hypothetical protein